MNNNSPKLFNHPDDCLPRIYTRKLRPEVAFIDALTHGVECQSESTWTLAFDKSKTRLQACSNNYRISNQTINGFDAINNSTFTPADPSTFPIVKISRSIITHIRFPSSATAIIVEAVNAKTDFSSERCLRTLIEYDGNSQAIIVLNHFAHFIKEKEECLCISVNTEDSECTPNGIRFSCGDISYLAYNYKPILQKPRTFFVIESEAPIKYEKFCSEVRKILSMVGFITGTFPYGPFFVFTAEETSNVLNSFVAYNDCVVKPCHSTYAVHSLNPYNYYANEDLKPNIGNVLEKELTPITRSHVETLLRQLDDSSFRMVFYTLIEVSASTHPLTYTSRLVLYAACLEMCANWAKKMSNESKPRSMYLSDGDRTRLIETFTNEIGGLEIEDKNTITIIQNRIQHSLFQISNADKLKNPFLLFNVELSEEDKRCLKLRDSILHGNDPTHTPFELKDSDKYISDCDRLCFNFYSLLWRVIMSSVGYRGCFRDVAAINGMFRQSLSNNGQPLIRHV